MNQHFQQITVRNSSATSKKSPLKFFLLVFALAIPIWLLSAFVGVIGSLKVPVTDLVLAFTPLTAAAILVYREEGLGGVRTLLKRVFDYKRIEHKSWYLPLICLVPAIYLLTSAVMRLGGHSARVEIHRLTLPLLLVLFFLLAVGEEAGWMGYAFDPMQDRWGALGASIILAIPWWVGHLPSIIQIGGTPADIAWWFPGAIALRILVGWLYNNTGKSLFAAILFHALLNLGRSASYPTLGSRYDPAYQAVGYSIEVIMALIVVLFWDSKTLTRARSRYGQG
jgi:membrane protease YdiL (CAAX protease family)